MSNPIFEVPPGRDPAPSHADETMDVAFTTRGCCFWIPLTSSGRPSSSTTTVSPWWRRIRAAADSTAAYNEPWWARGWNKVREWSEKVAGPKWKTFIRRFGRNRAANGRFGGMRAGAGSQFRYDPLSYAMNFDEGHDDHFDDGEALRRDFSSRYASIPASCKGSMDLGKDDGPLFT